VVFRAAIFKLLVSCGAEGYVSGFQDAAARLDASKDTKITPHDVVAFLAKRISCCGNLYVLVYRLNF